MSDPVEWPNSARYVAPDRHASWCSDHDHDGPCLDQLLRQIGVTAWRTEPDGPGSGDDRYGDVPATEVGQ